MKRMTGGEAVVEALVALGVEHVFGIVSVHNLPIYEAMRKRGDITPINVRHEQGAAHAADAYARATGKLGVCITSTGPGAANAVPGLFEAGFASSRVLMITGQIESRFYGKGKGFLHESERQLNLLRDVTRMTESVRRTEDIAAAVVRVATDIGTGRPQPGAVEIPIDLQYAEADVEVPAVVDAPLIQPHEDELAQAAELLAGARRPLLWAGGGVVSSGAAEALTDLAERLGAPVVTSITGRGSIPEDHPLCIGAVADLPPVAAVIADADVVLAVGTRFQMAPTRRWTLPIGGQLIHLDADPGVLGRNYEPAVGVLSDARLGLEELGKRVQGGQSEAGWTDRGAAARAEAHEFVRGLIGADQAAIMDAMRELLPRAGNVVRDATIPAYQWGNRIMPILTPRTSMHPTSAAIGPGLPLAIGAALGNGQPTALIQGDGGFMLSIGELATAVQYHLPIVVCVFNDRGYGVLRNIQDSTFQHQTAVDLATPDFAKVAEGMGMIGEQVASAEEFRDAFGRAIERGGPTLLDIDLLAMIPIQMRPAPQQPAR